MTDTIRITREEVEREARWLMEAGHMPAASLLLALWRELSHDRPPKPPQVHGTLTVEDGEGTGDAE